MKKDIMKKKEGHDALVKGNQPKEQSRSGDTRAKVLSGIHKRTHVGGKSSKGMTAGIPS